MEDLGKSFPAAEGLVDAEEGQKPKHVNEFCLNCGTKLEDLYCHHCGQKDIPRRRTLGELIENFMQSLSLILTKKVYSKIVPLYKINA